MKYSSPVYRIISVPIEKMEPNTYNPNAVALLEMRLLYDSIRADGKLPVSVINKSLDCRMASAIRHNRARGSHDVEFGEAWRAVENELKDEEKN